MQRKYSLNICPLKYYGLLSTLKSLRNTCKNNYINNCDYESFAAKLAKCQSANKLVYNKLISTKCTHPTHNQQKWQKDCHQNAVDSIDWRDAYQLASKYTKSTRIIEFQYKVLHRRIATNDFLTKIGVRDDPNCSFCNGEQENLLTLKVELALKGLWWTFFLLKALATLAARPFGAVCPTTSGARDEV